MLNPADPDLVAKTSFADLDLLPQYTAVIEWPIPSGAAT
jgi:hypothetical protein